MIRNYSSPEKWIPAKISAQTGPVSYKCSVDNKIMKRHQDQIIKTTKPVNIIPELADRSVNEEIISDPIVPNNDPITEPDTDVSTTRKSSVVLEVPKQTDNVIQRKSSRIIRAPDRLNL